MAEPADAPLPAALAPSAPVEPRPTQQWGRTLIGQAATVSATMGPLVRRAGDRLAAASPMTLLLGMLAILTTLSIVAALTSAGSLGVAATVLFIPVLSGAMGAATMWWLQDRRSMQVRREDARDESRALHQIEHTLGYVDAKLTTALTQFGTERHNEAVIGMFQAKAATEIYLGSVDGPGRPAAPDAEPEHIDLVSQYGLAELLTPRRPDGQLSSTETSNRSCA